MEIKKIIIVGSKVQSWICAYILKTQLPFLDIQIIDQSIEEDNEINVGTFALTEKLLEFIDIKDFFQETKGTINVGKRYNNWNKEKKVFTSNNSFNSLRIDEIQWPQKHETDNDENQLDPEKEILLFNDAFKRAYLNHLYNDTSIGFCDLTSLFNEKLPDLPLEKIIELFDVPSRSIGISYKSTLLLAYIKNLATKHEVTLINDFFVGVEQAEDETIISVIGQKEKYPCDFVFDCTGEFRDVMSNFSNYNFWLNPAIEADCAIQFEVDSSNAKIWKDLYVMRHGYLIEIHLQDKTYYTYIFNQTYASDLEIISETENFLNLSKIPKFSLINLNFGCIDKAIIKNCFALGNTAGTVDPIFIDPIDLLLKELDAFITMIIDNDDDSDPDAINIPDETFMLKTLEFNETFNNFFKEISDLTILYTWTNLEDAGSYWNACKSKYDSSATEITSGIEETMSFKINYWRYFHLYYNTENTSFKFLNEYDFFVPLYGNRIYNIADRKKSIQNNDILDFCTNENYYFVNNAFQQFKENLMKNGLSVIEYQKKYELTT